MLQELKWPSKRQYQNIVKVRSIMKKRTPNNFEDPFQFNTNPMGSHPLTLQIPSSSINALRYS